MSYPTNELGQRVGALVENWSTRPRPHGEVLQGNWCRLEPVDPDRHASDLFQSHLVDEDGANWTYLPYGPFNQEVDYRDWMAKTCLSDDPYFYAVIDQKTGKAIGVASYLRINPEMGSIEVGHIHFSPLLQRTPHATEAMYLMMKQAFDWGYRRYEWKCNALNEASCKAALRFGFTSEGIHRQAGVYKGRNRDTAWFSILDGEWPEIRGAFEVWLSPDNFDDDGRQKSRLACRRTD